MNEDDEVLLAWLVKRQYSVVSIGNRCWLGQVDWANGQSPTVDDLSKWVSIMDGSGSLRVELFTEQRGKRRPLRGLVREWVIGL